MKLREKKRAKVFNAAKELFGRFGFRKTTVDEIADLAGLSKRTMYQVFRSKEQILAELVLREARAFRHSCLEQINHLDDPAEKFWTFCDLSSMYFEENPFLGRVLADDAGLFSPFLGNELHLVEEGIREIIRGLVEEGITRGTYRRLNVADTVQCIMVLFRGFTYDRRVLHDGQAEWVSFILRAIENPGLNETGSA